MRYRCAALDDAMFVNWLNLKRLTKLMISEKSFGYSKHVTFILFIIIN